MSGIALVVALITKQIRQLDVVQDINASVIRATSGRHLFVTSQGYIGLGPYSARVGDNVAIFLGGSTPFVMKQDTSQTTKTGQWLLRGDCYVHGWMDGELVRNEETQDWGNLVLT